MTARVVRRKRPESDDAKYNRLTKRAVRRLPMTDAETWWLWNEKSKRTDRARGLPRDPWSYGAASFLPRRPTHCCSKDETPWQNSKT